MPQFFPTSLCSIDVCVPCNTLIISVSCQRTKRMQPIHDMIRPRRRGMRYLPVAEVEDQYNIGMFIFPPHTRIPLHDHPGMVVLSRILYGELKVKTFDIIPKEEKAGVAVIPNPSTEVPNQNSGWAATILDKFSLGSLLPDRSHSSTSCNPPALSTDGDESLHRAVEHELTTFTAPEISVLYPYKGNAHEFTSGEYGAAVLDVLLPPYDEGDNRDCTFYRKGDEEGGGEWPSRQQSGGERLAHCSLVPIDMPDDFSCVSGSYWIYGKKDDDE